MEGAERGEECDSAEEPEDSPGHFPPTRWTRVLAANGNGEDAERALNELCQAYWYPIYSFVRRKGKSVEDAQDLTQGFFADLLWRDSLERVNPEEGRLRAFLLGAVKNYMAYEHRKKLAQKRGAGVVPLSIDFEIAERRYACEPSHNDSPDHDFDRRWALITLERVIDCLQGEYSRKGMDELFGELAPFLAGQAPPDHGVTAKKLGMKVGAVRTALSRMRRRYREILVLEVAGTVASPDFIEDELEALIASLRPGLR